MPEQEFWPYVDNLDKLKAEETASLVQAFTAATGHMTPEARSEFFNELDRRMGAKPVKAPRMPLSVLRRIGARMR